MSMPLRPGDPVRLGRYELVGRLGEGGMGTVYLGRDSDGGRPVAIKMVRSEFAHDTEFRGRFRSEVNRARQVPSFSTAEVLDADPDHEPPYLVVEYVDGPSLAVEVRERGPLSGAALQGVAVGIATALTAIHGAEVIHRDLKPGNVLLARGGIKVIDFGIARAFEATSRHTRTDQMLGTVSYMAPERFDPADARPVTPAADIFAWGTVVAFAATGRSPFAADSAAGTAMRILTSEPDLTGVPESLRAAVEWTLAKDPQARPTARELLDLLLGGEAPRPVPEIAPVPVKARRGRTVAGVATVLAVLAAAGAGLTIRNRLQDGSAGTGASSAGSSSSPATAAASNRPAPKPSARSLSPLEKLQAIRNGRHKTLIHSVQLDRDLAMESHDTEIQAGDGTGHKSEFALIPAGVDVLIQSLAASTPGRPVCLGVRITAESAKLTPSECFTGPGTQFELIPAEKKEDQGRPAYYIYNDSSGYLLWDGKAFYVQEVGDGDPIYTFSFVDRGPLPSPSAT
ncbi:serine/threonine protein kinase [Actinoplanes sp. SE50]|uniref:serine/threonine-protein kinase n=1 Tax=unclassified Actinoplanes TaxID=2626549 RepID=UPI00023EC7A5|nr:MULTISPECIES: serine/threonine-protein kinase [unclassified Actinoplanes]AEV84203.1 Serine/threonine protein kinase [Actinoplanes sp. SE50/110]ATO82595.1 serine/threonine protein kinase [Actinoplanes sp. SE50]SLM00002.1 serine/threonine protein kinase [Actinoplanes sp. SE50/110]